MKTQQAQHTTASARPTDFLGLPYSSALLLDARLGSAITDAPAFSEGCQEGFGGYFDAIRELGDDVQSLPEVRRFIEGLVTDEIGPSGVRRRFWLHWNIGYGIGWLSALALAQYHEAQEGLHELLGLLDREQQPQQWPPRNSRSVDSAGWPLDM